MRGDRDVGGVDARLVQKSMAAQDLPAYAPSNLPPDPRGWDFGFCPRVGKNPGSAPVRSGRLRCLPTPGRPQKRGRPKKGGEHRE